MANLRKHLANRQLRVRLEGQGVWLSSRALLGLCESHWVTTSISVIAKKH